MKFHIVTVGSCRGMPFGGSKTISFEAIESICRLSFLEDNRYDIFEDIEEVCEEFSNLFYNVDRKEVLHIKKLLASVKRRKKPLIEVWEEGTTGIVNADVMTKKELRKQILLADREAQDGILRSDVTNIFKKKN